uniref:Uncharacterized protein n=1 Tax=Timema genevievae TaxID=629358 RepID=A0A7R9JV75_TIMGE|nr:unnamed protein product [Timema genevievae]
MHIKTKYLGTSRVGLYVISPIRTMTKISKHALFVKRVELRLQLTLSACPARRLPQTKRRCLVDDSIPVWRSYVQSGCRQNIHRNQSVKLEPCDTENVKIEDTTELLQTEISISKWNPKVDFSNETILGLEVDYLTHDSTNKTPSSSINTPNESELETSCSLFPIKEEPSARLLQPFQSTFYRHQILQESNALDHVATKADMLKRFNSSIPLFSKVEYRKSQDDATPETLELLLSKRNDHRRLPRDKHSMVPSEGCRPSGPSLTSPPPLFTPRSPTKFGRLVKWAALNVTPSSIIYSSVVCISETHVWLARGVSLRKGEVWREQIASSETYVWLARGVSLRKGEVWREQIASSETYVWLARGVLLRKGEVWREQIASSETYVWLARGVSLRKGEVWREQIASSETYVWLYVWLARGVSLRKGEVWREQIANQHIRL